MTGRRQFRDPEAGFTLIELLIVIIVLGLLTAIVLFALGTFKQDSALGACRADVKQVRTAETAYKLKNDGYTNIHGLVVAKMLQTPPSSPEYTVTANPVTGVVTTNLPDCGS